MWICEFLGWIVGGDAEWVGAVCQAGLSALKTPQSYAANSSREDPLTLVVRA